MTALLVAIGGGLGAVARFGVASMIPRTRLGFPSGITIVNVVGSFLLGLVVGEVEASAIALAIEPVTLGLLGGFTTFSTWMIDIDEAPTKRMAVAIVAIPLVAGLAAAAAGLWLASSL
jgi:CrcB protein